MNAGQHTHTHTNAGAMADHQVQNTHTGESVRERGRGGRSLASPIETRRHQGRVRCLTHGARWICWGCLTSCVAVPTPLLLTYTHAQAQTQKHRSRESSILGQHRCRQSDEGVKHSDCVFVDHAAPHRQTHRHTLQQVQSSDYVDSCLIGYPVKQH